MESVAPAALWTELAEWVRLDVRTPAEYAQGHVPGAYNLPLFTNEERAVVGTLYKQVSPAAAFLRGLDFAGAKMRWYVEEAQRLAPGRRAVLHCWRGGQRSGSLAWLLRQAGWEIVTVAGGYKAYRQYLHQRFTQPHFRMVVLGGATGSGKTEILQALAATGEAIIDLEQIAHHKGSAFGRLGQLPQPTVEQFENDLFEVYRQLPSGQRVWVENESKAIGQVYLPAGFWEQFRHSPMVELKPSLERRVQYLVEAYGQYPAAALQEGFDKIKKRLGGLQHQQASAALAQGDYSTAVRIALHYYDKAYTLADEKCAFAPVIPWPVGEEDHSTIAQQLKNYAEQHGL